MIREMAACESGYLMFPVFIFIHEKIYIFALFLIMVTSVYVSLLLAMFAVKIYLTLVMRYKKYKTDFKNVQ